MPAVTVIFYDSEATGISKTTFHWQIIQQLVLSYG